MVAAGQRKLPEQVGCDRRLVRRHRMDGCGERVHPLPQRRREHLLELRQRGQRRVGAVSEALRCGRAQTDRHGDGFVVGEEQRRERGAGLEPVSPTGARHGLDAVTEFAQPLDIAAERAICDPETIGEFGSTPMAVRLQEVQQGEHP